MPGMMDTILNLGLDGVAVEGLAARTSNARFAYDSYRRLIQMFGEVVDGVEAHRFESRARRAEARSGRRAGRRARRPTISAAGRGVPADLRGGDRRRLPAGRPRAAAPGRCRRVRLVGLAAGAGLPAHLRDPRRHRHRRQRRPDGVRQQGRRDRVPACASRATRRPARPGSTANSSPMRRERTSSPAIRTPDPIERMRDGAACRLRAARRDARPPRGALPRDAGHRVHGRGRHAVPAPDPHRQADRGRGPADRGRDGRRGADLT